MLYKSQKFKINDYSILTKQISKINFRYLGIKEKEVKSSKYLRREMRSIVKKSVRVLKL